MSNNTYSITPCIDCNHNWCVQRRADAQNTKPNVVQVCKHGQLKRQCNICDLETELFEAKALIQTAKTYLMCAPDAIDTALVENYALDVYSTRELVKAMFEFLSGQSIDDTKPVVCVCPIPRDRCPNCVNLCWACHKASMASAH